MVVKRMNDLKAITVQRNILVQMGSLWIPLAWGRTDGCLFPAEHGPAIGSMALLSRMFSVTLLPNERVN